MTKKFRKWTINFKHIYCMHSNKTFWISFKAISWFLVWISWFLLKQDFSISWSNESLFPFQKKKKKQTRLFYLKDTMCYEHSLYWLFRENQALQFDRLDHFKKVQTYNLLFKNSWLFLFIVNIWIYTNFQIDKNK